MRAACVCTHQWIRQKKMTQVYVLLFLLLLHFVLKLFKKKKKNLSDITKGSGIILRLLRKPLAGRLLHHWRPVAALEAPAKTSVLAVGCKQRNKKDSDSLESGWITLMVSSCSTRVQDLKKSIQFISVCYQEHWQGVMYSLTERSDAPAVALCDPLGSLLTGQHYQLSGFIKTAERPGGILKRSRPSATQNKRHSTKCSLRPVVVGPFPQRSAQCGSREKQTLPTKDLCGLFCPSLYWTAL